MGSTSRSGSTLTGSRDRAFVMARTFQIPIAWFSAETKRRGRTRALWQSLHSLTAFTCQVRAISPLTESGGFRRRIHQRRIVGRLRPTDSCTDATRRFRNAELRFQAECMAGSSPCGSEMFDQHSPFGNHRWFVLPQQRIPIVRSGMAMNRCHGCHPSSAGL